MTSAGGVTVSIGQLRQLVARAAVEHLEPDLVILDEFQRFKDLLDADDEGARAGQRDLRSPRREGAAAVGDAVQDVHAARRARRRRPLPGLHPHRDVPRPATNERTSSSVNCGPCGNGW